MAARMEDKFVPARWQRRQHARNFTGIHPKRPAGRLSLERYQALLKAVIKVLERSIKMGGTTLRDFVSANGEPGYFRQVLCVYEREGQPCRRCHTPIRRIVLTARSTYYCPRCQH